MAKVSAALRKRLLDQQKEMDTGGMFIRNKDFTKAKLRILPAGEEVPGARWVGYYCKDLSGDKKSTVSPETYGKPCPIADALNHIKTTGSKGERDRAFNYVNRNTEYWMKVLVRGDEGEGKHPKIRILQAKRTVYQQVVRWMSDEDMGEDITDPEEGCDVLIKKEGSNRDTTWHCDKMRPSSLVDDETLYEAILEANEEMDVRRYFQRVDWDVLAEIYEGLTGEEMPESYQEEFGDADSDAGQDEEGDDDAEDEAEDEEGDDDADDEGDDEGDDDDEGELVEEETVVSFEDDDGNVIQGTYMCAAEDDEDSAEVKDDEGEVWTVAYDDLTIVEEDEEDAEEDADDDDGDDDADDDDGDDDEPEEAAPARRRRAARPPEKPSSKKPGKGEKSSKVEKSSGKATGKASSAIRDRMSAANKAASSKSKTGKASKSASKPSSKPSVIDRAKAAGKKKKGRRG